MKYAVKILIGVGAATSFGAWQHDINAGVFVFNVLVFVAYITED